MDIQKIQELAKFLNSDTFNALGISIQSITAIIGAAAVWKRKAKKVFKKLKKLFILLAILSIIYLILHFGVLPMLIEKLPEGARRIIEKA